MSYSAGIYSSYPTQVAAWGDVNNDGCVDVFIGNETYYSELFMNQCDGTFKNKAEEFGLIHMSFVKGASWGDINNDGWIDLYISSYMQPNRCLINLGKDRGFRDLKNANILDVKESFSTWFFDFNNDGFEDLFVGGFNSQAVYLFDSNRDPNYFNAGIYLNRGDFKFEFLPQSKHYNSMGANFGDMSGDGFLDYYLGVGAPSLIYLESNRVMLNRAGKDVMDISFVSGLGHLQKGHRVAFADVDMDGDLDIYLVNGGWVPVDNFPNSFFINQSPEHHWVTLRLIGTKTNRAAIGARIKLTLKTPNGSIRYIYRTISAGGSFGGSPFQQTIAFSFDELLQIDILWPSGTKQSFNQLPIKAVYQINEDGNIKRL